MRKTILFVTAASILLASCGWRDSRVNPRNWFGKSREVVAETAESTAEEVNPLIPTSRRSVLARRTPEDRSVEIDRITELRVEPTATGAIVYASGIAARQGAFAARLTAQGTTAEPDENGVLSLSFRVTYPRYATNQGSEFSRTVHEGFSLTNLELQRVRTIRVTAAQNARETRRRR